MNVVPLSLGVLEGRYRAITRDFEGYVDHPDILDARFDDFTSVCDPSAVGECLYRFITAELDHSAPGSRGLGRLSARVPRLGAYFRQEVARLPSADRTVAYRLIQNVMLGGYLVYTLFVNYDMAESKFADGEALYDAWIPRIYNVRLRDVAASLRDCMALCSNTAAEELTSFFRNHGMVRQGRFARDKTDEILRYYVLAGTCLRIREVIGYGVQGTPREGSL